MKEEKSFYYLIHCNYCGKNFGLKEDTYYDSYEYCPNCDRKLYIDNLEKCKFYFELEYPIRVKTNEYYIMLEDYEKVKRNKEYKVFLQNIDKSIKEQKEEFENYIDNYIEHKLVRKSSDSKTDKNISKKIIESGKLLDYLNCIIKAYSIIYYLKNRMVELMYLKDMNNEAFNYDKKEFADNVKEKYEEVKKTYQEDYNNLLDKVEKNKKIYNKIIKETINKKPKEPICNFKKDELKHLELPAIPKYKVPRFYNRKSVKNKNELLYIEYKEELEKYNEKEKYKIKLEKYENVIKKYNLKIEKLKKEKEKELLNSLKDDFKDIKIKIKNDKNEYINENINLLTQYPSFKINNLLEEEIKKMKILLDENIVKLNKIYKYDIIYPKYKNYIAICSIYEYLDSKRVSSLEGIDGAYNIYENDVKSNLIINRLDKIINSLEQIKLNQYLLFIELNNIQKKLIDINNLQRKMIEEVNKNVEESVGIIGRQLYINNMINADINNNLKMNKYYSKQEMYLKEKQNELLNSLGFLIALK